MKKSRHCENWQRNAVAVAVASCFVIASPVYANPTGADVVSGVVSMAQQGNALNITNSPGAIINWQSFSIGANEATRFIQQSAASGVLNRVTGIDPSSILGTLQSNGRVFLINPNGVLFGAGAQVDVAGLVVSTLNLSNADFLAGRYNFTANANAGGIDNQGSLTALPGGHIYLVAPDIGNSGIITSPQGDVILAAGNSVELVNASTPDMRVVIDAPNNQALNLGSIVANSGRVGIYAGLINHHGIVSADTATVGATGKITFKATKDINLEPGSVISASGTAGGVKDGGEVRIIADGKLAMRQGAQVLVEGGVDGGNGGFLELSGLTGLSLRGIYSGRAHKAGFRNGSLLLDPMNINITSAGTHSMSGSSIAASSGTASASFAIAPASLNGGWADVSLAATNNITVSSPIGNADINNGTAGGSLTLTAGNDITVGAPIGASGTRFAHDLTLTANNNVNINSSIHLGSNTLTLTANADMSGSGNVLVQPNGNNPVIVDTLGNIFVNAVALTVRGGTASSSGTTANATLSAGGNMTLTLGAGGLTVQGGNATASAGNSSSATATAIATVHADGDLTVNTAGNIQVQGGSAIAIASGSGSEPGIANAYADAELSATGLLTITASNVYVQGGSNNIHASASGGSATATANAKLSAADLTIDTAGTIQVQGGNAGAVVSSNGANKATAEAKAEISVTGNLEITNGSSGSASSVQVAAGNAVAYANGSNSATPASPDANADAGATMSAGTLTLRANGLSIRGGVAHAQAGGSYSSSSFGSFSFSGSANNRSVSAQAKALVSVSTVTELTLGSSGLLISSASGSSISTAIINGAGGVNTALADRSALLEVTGSGNVLLTSAGGISIQGGSARASAGGSGTNTATEYANAGLSAASLKIDTSGTILVQGGSADASISGSGANKATAEAKASISVTGSLEITNGPSGSVWAVSVQAGSANAYAYGSGATAPAAPDALANANATMSTGTLILRAGGLSIQGNQAHAQAGSSYFNLVANRSAEAQAKALVSAGTVAELALGSDGLLIRAYGSSTAIVNGSGGVNTALANHSAYFNVTGDVVSLTSGGGIRIQGGGATALADGTGGTNTATDYGNAGLIVGGNLALSVGDLIVYGGGSANARSLGSGSNSGALAEANAGLTAGGSLTIVTTGGINMNGGASPFASASGAGAAVARARGDIYGGDLTLTTAGLSITGGYSPSVNASGTGSALADAGVSIATVTPGGALAITTTSGDVSLSGGSYFGPPPTTNAVVAANAKLFSYGPITLDIAGSTGLTLTGYAGSGILPSYNQSGSPVTITFSGPGVISITASVDPAGYFDAVIESLYSSSPSLPPVVQTAFNTTNPDPDPDPGTGMLDILQTEIAGEEDGSEDDQKKKLYTCQK